MEATVKILLIDDDEVNRLAVCQALITTGVKIKLLETNSGVEAIAILEQQPVDCILLSDRQRHGDGIGFIRQLQTQGIKLPVVVLTEQTDAQITEQLLQAGASECIAKSQLSPTTLAQALRYAIRLHRAETAAFQANQELQASEERYRLILAAANDGIWDWYCMTNEVYCNDRLLEIIGVSRSEFALTPSAFIERMHPEDLPRIRAIVAAHIQRGEKCELEFRLRHTSGQYRYCSARGKVQHDAYGCPYRMCGIISDVTERQQLEQALRVSESRFRRLVESNIMGVILADLNGNVIEANDAFLQMVGYSRQQLQAGKLRWQQMTPPEYAAVDRLAVEQLQTTGVCTAFEKEYMRQDGSRVPILLGAAMVEQTEATAICFVVDLSDRQQAEAKIIELNRDLERRVAEFQTLLDVIPIGIAIAQDPECRYIHVNAVLTKLLGLAADSNSNASLSAPTAEKPAYKVYSQGKEVGTVELPMQSAAIQGQEVLDAELDVVVPQTGTVLKLLANAAPLFDEQGKCRGSVGAFLDITERKQVEEQERFLAEASAILGTSLDYQTTLEHLARHVVSQLADWCTIHTLDPEGNLKLLTLAHTDPLKVEWTRQLQQRYPPNPKHNFGAPQVIRSGKSELHPQVSDSLLADVAHDAEHLQLLRQAGIKSAICVPMRARGRTLGAISFVSVKSGRSYTQAELALAEDLGRRAGLAVDNARLYQEANEIGENLRQAIIILGEQQQQLRVLQRITNLLNQRLTNLPGLLQVMVEAVCDGIPEAQFALIVLHSSQTNRLELTATAGVGANNPSLTAFVNAASGLLEQVFSTGKSQLLQQQPKSAAHKNQPDTLAVQPPAAVYAVAIASAPGGRLGVLAVGSWEDSDAFDVEDRNLLSAVGEQAAIAINNARLINALEEREERLAIQNETLARQNRELEMTRQQVERQNLELIAAARLKSQFLATMSHELRTPMNAVIGFAQVLLRQRSAPLCASQVDMVQRILSNGKNLLALINDILDLSKIEAGRLELQLEEFNLSQLILTTVAELRSLAEQKQLPLRVKIELSNPLVINDSTRLRQILVNLLSNAIKFTETGSVELKAWEPTPNQLLLSVIDTGIGIAESELEHIFEEFRQVDQTTTRKHGGTGLGLAITKSLVQMMHGNITVESRLGQGATFRLQLPRRVEQVSGEVEG